MLTVEQRQRHLRQLNLLQAEGSHDYDEQTRHALHTVWDKGGQAATIALRPGFVVRGTPLAGEMSDKDSAPSPGQRPPLARLVAPRGVALRLELIALFIAQFGNGRRSVGRALGA